ncbi:MAG: hypothetical protein R2911_02350 [Caldilineaceae bacterium]
MKKTQLPNEKRTNLSALGGQMLFQEGDATSAYRVLKGEVLILRQGRVVDLVEAGELLDARIWPGAMAVAWTECTLEAVRPQPQPLTPSIPAAFFDRALAYAA